LKSIDKILEYADDFPTLPTIFSRLLDLMSDPNSTVADVSHIISSDQASAVKIIRTVNSSVFGLQKKINSISEAIFYLGFNEVKNLLLSLSVIKLFSTLSTVKNFNLVDFWKHSIAVGVISRSLCKMIGGENIEEFFLCGLLHDIGKLLFLKYLQKDYAEVFIYAQENNKSIYESEIQILDTTHTRVADLLLTKWQFPSSIKKGVRHHHHININDPDWQIIVITHISNILAQVLMMGGSGNIMIPKPNSEVWDLLKLPEGVLTAILPQIIQNYRDSVNVLLLD
jgi:putative nucleotidyltransferase with HDIG domain